MQGCSCPHPWSLSLKHQDRKSQGLIQGTVWEGNSPFLSARRKICREEKYSQPGPQRGRRPPVASDSSRDPTPRRVGGGRVLGSRAAPPPGEDPAGIRAGGTLQAEPSQPPARKQRPLSFWAASLPTATLAAMRAHVHTQAHTQPHACGCASGEGGPRGRTHRAMRSPTLGIRGPGDAAAAPLPEPCQLGPKRDVR